LIAFEISDESVISYGLSQDILIKDLGMRYFSAKFILGCDFPPKHQHASVR
jgi:hypothetical protein